MPGIRNVCEMSRHSRRPAEISLGKKTAETYPYRSWCCQCQLFSGVMSRFTKSTASSKGDRQRLAFLAVSVSEVSFQNWDCQSNIDIAKLLAMLAPGAARTLSISLISWGWQIAWRWRTKGYAWQARGALPLSAVETAVNFHFNFPFHIGMKSI